MKKRVKRCFTCGRRKYLVMLCSLLSYLLLWNILQWKMSWNAYVLFLERVIVRICSFVRILCVLKWVLGHFELCWTIEKNSMSSLFIVSELLPHILHFSLCPMSYLFLVPKKKHWLLDFWWNWRYDNNVFKVISFNILFCWITASDDN